MEMREVIQPHFHDICDVVDQVSLASKLRSLTPRDIDEIQRQTAYSGHYYGVLKLYNAIIGKVEWLEFCAALRKENLKPLLKILEEEYYRQHPDARPCPQNKNLEPGINHSEEEPTDSSTDCNKDDEAISSAAANSSPDITAKASTSASTSSITKGSCGMIVKDCSNIVIHQAVYIQMGDNNKIETSPHLQNGGTSLREQCEEDYEVCVENDNSKGLEKIENRENVSSNNSSDTDLCSRVPNELTVPENISPQLSSSSFDSQDGGSPKVCYHSETDEHTAVKLIYQERNGDDSAPSENMSLTENTNTTAQSRGLVKTSEGIRLEELGISLRTENKRHKEGEEEEKEEEDEHEAETKLKTFSDQQEVTK